MTAETPKKTFYFNFSQLDIKKEAIANFIGYTDFSSSSEPILESIRNALKDVENLCNIRGAYTILDDLTLDQENKRLFSHKHWFETGQIVSHQLRRSERAAWFVCTAGKEITDYSKALYDKGDTLEGYLVDVIANVVVEAAMDLIQAKLKTEVAKQGDKITNRYSPGYCEWNITEQKKLFSIFPEDYLDISLSASCIMIPIKTVSGIIGIGKDVSFNDYTCNLCNDTNCPYRNKNTSQKQKARNKEPKL